MISKVIVLLLSSLGIVLAGDQVIVGPGRGHVSVDHSFTTVGRSVQGTRCVIKAHSRAWGEVQSGEGFTGNFEGDAGSKTFRPIGLVAWVNFDMAISETREVPNDVRATQRFYSCHVPYELPYVRVELVQRVDCIDCTATNKK